MLYFKIGNGERRIKLNRIAERGYIYEYIEISDYFAVGIIPYRLKLNQHRRTISKNCPLNTELYYFLLFASFAPENPPYWNSCDCSLM